MHYYNYAAQTHCISCLWKVNAEENAAYLCCFFQLQDRQIAQS